jgi:predicted RNase H-like HicB family nuclease
MIPIAFDILIFKEDQTFVSYCPELDLSSCGHSVEEARNNLKTAVRLFLEEAEKMGTLEDLLIEAGYKKDQAGIWHPPRMVATELVSMA